MAEPGFWDNQERAREVIDEANRLKGWLEPWTRAHEKIGTLRELADLLKAEPDPEMPSGSRNSKRSKSSSARSSCAPCCRATTICAMRS
jgi:hypothetical protein